MDNKLVPENNDGKNTDFHHNETLATEAAAKDCFRRASKRLLNPPVWQKLVGTLSAAFVLTDSRGVTAERLAMVNDYIKIDIPGPGNAAGNGVDWVKVEMIEAPVTGVSADESLGIRLRATAAPEGTVATAHFFKDTTTSSFIITRKANLVTAAYFGRNEKANTSTGNMGNNLRNALVAAGAAAGLSELQWKTLLKALLEPEIGETSES